MPNSETKTCQNCKQNFVIEPEDFQFYEKMKVPPPTWCPECRFQRRLIFWNQSNLFRKKDDLTGEEIFSSFSSESPVKIYKNEYWVSDAFDASAYSREYDFSRPFFEQFKELFYSVPQATRSVQKLINSDYCNQASYLKNCYLLFNGGEAEDCMYGIAFVKMKSCIDFYQSTNCELSYEIFSVSPGYKNFFTNESGGCRDVWFCLNCLDCSDCFGCVNLRHKQYYIFNQPYTKEEYQKKIKEFNLGSYKSLEEIKKRVSEFRPKFPMRYMHGFHNVNVSGDYIYDSKNAKYCYQVIKVEDGKYVQNVANSVRDSYDYTNWGENSELIYETMSCGYDCKNLKFCSDCWPACRDSEYIIGCRSSDNLFGCVGLKKKFYCILNKEYTKEDFYALREKIIKQMAELPYKDSKGRIYSYGEFFPPEISPSSYNESAAIDYFPLTKEEILEKGFEWREMEQKKFSSTISAAKLPDHIDDVAAEAIVKEVIECLSCKRAYRILGEELNFYKRFQIPLPRKCYLCRYNDRLKFRNPVKLYSRKCLCAGEKSENNVYKNTSSHFHGSNPCSNEFETSYIPNRLEIVYCESCYQSEVV